MNIYLMQREKKTRALLCLLASKSQDIKSNSRVNLASIIELLHTATLVHDDVVDDSEKDVVQDLLIKFGQIRTAS